MACSAVLLAGSVHAVTENNSFRQLAPPLHEHGQQEIALCGHNEGDTVELRDRAALLTHWCDGSVSDERFWQRFKILGFNDFHCQLESRMLFGRPVGGAAVSAAYLQQESGEVDGRAIIVHAHGFTNQLVSNNEGKEILITQAFSRGTAYADIDVAIDPRTGDIVEKTVSIVSTWADAEPGLSPDSAIAAMTQQAVASVEVLVNQMVGSTAQAITREANSAGESALGNLSADAQRMAIDTDIALMNPGGTRADLPVGDITWGDLVLDRQSMSPAPLTGFPAVRGATCYFNQPSAVNGDSA